MDDRTDINRYIEPAHPNSCRNVWSPEDDALLTELWDKIPTVTAMAIGLLLSKPRTKNAVIGRAKRLFLAHRKAGQPRRHPLGITPKRVRRTPRNPVIKPLALPLFVAPQEYNAIRVPLIETRAYQCRAIIESTLISEAGLAICCGNPFPPGQTFSYCPYHMGLYTYVKRRSS